VVVARSQWLRMTIDSAVLLLTKQGQPVTAEAIKSALGLALDKVSVAQVADVLAELRVVDG